MNNLGSYVFIAFFVAVLLTGLIKKENVYELFIDGAKSGIKTAASILPTFIAIFIAVSVLKSSGLMEMLCNFIAPAAERLGFPKEVLPICLLSPVSGSGSIAVFEQVIKQYGADSFVGRVASVISGSTETTFYAIAVYYGAVGIKKTRHTVFWSLCADFTSFLLASVFVKLFFY